MSTRRIVLAAVVAFLLAWGALTSFALWAPRSPGVSPSAPLDPAALRGVSREEIARHNRADDCWIVIRGKVYDVTRYISSHPAPRRTIVDNCGKESTWAFETKEGGRPHSPQAWQHLETYLVGEARD